MESLGFTLRWPLSVLFYFLPVLIAGLRF